MSSIEKSITDTRSDKQVDDARDVVETLHQASVNYVGQIGNGDGAQDVGASITKGINHLAADEGIIVVGSGHDNVGDNVEHQGKAVALGSAVHVREFGVDGQQRRLQDEQDGRHQTDEVVGLKETGDVLVERVLHVDFKVDGP